MDAVELAAPLALGARYSILGPPGTGRSTLLRNLTAAIQRAVPEVMLVVLLIDQPIDESMEWRADLGGMDLLSVGAEDGIEGIVRVVDEVEQRVQSSRASHTVLCVDSMSAILRAVNAHSPEDPRVLSGGVLQTAVTRVRQLLALGRARSNGQTVTVLCTATMDAEVSADDLLARELIGTGNAELHTDALLARSEVFPALDLERSGTRADERILGSSATAARARLRARCLERGPHAAMDQLLEGLREQGSLARLLHQLGGEPTEVQATLPQP